MIIDERACIRCGLCVDRCPTECLTMNRFRVTPAEARKRVEQGGALGWLPVRRPHPP